MSLTQWKKTWEARLSAVYDQLVNFIIGSKAVYAVLAVILAVSAYIASTISIEAGTEKYMLKDSARNKISDEITEHFVPSDPVFIAYRHPDIFSRELLIAIREALGQVSTIKVPGPNGDPIYAVEDITSLLSLKDIRGSEMNFETIPLVPDPIPTSPEDLNEIKRRALNNPIIHDNFIADNANSALVAVRLNKSMRDPEIASTIRQMQQVLAATAGKIPDLTFHVAGYPVQEFELNRHQVMDLAFYLPLIVVIMALLFYIFVRRVVATAVCMLGMGITLIASVAALKLQGGSIHLTTTLLPVIIPTITTAEIIHYVAEFGKYSQEFPQQDFRRMTIKQLMFPVFLSCLTNALGFYSIAAGSGMVALDDFAFSAGTGILVTFVIVVLMAGLLVRVRRPETIISPKGLALSTRFDKYVIGFSNKVIQHKKAYLAGSILVMAIFGAGIFLIESDWEVISTFSKSSDIRKDTDFINNNFGGVTSFVLSVKRTSSKEDAFLDPEAVGRVAHLEQVLRERYGFTRVISYLDYLRLMNREFFNGDPLQYHVPDTLEKASQLMLLNSDERVREYLDDNHTFFRLVARKPIHSAVKILRLTEQLEQELQERFPPSQGYTSYVTGKEISHSEAIDTMTNSQIWSLSTSVLTIFLCMFLVFRSWLMGLLCIPTNIAPIFFGLGTMGYLGIKLSPATVFLASAAIGIAVDDTIHFLKEIKERLRVHGNLERAVRETFHLKGAGAIWTCVILVCGFCITIGSSYQIMKEFGVIFSITMASSVIFEITMLPSLLLCLNTKLGLKKHELGKGE